MEKVILALGANLGDYNETFSLALFGLSFFIDDIKSSSVYTTRSLLEDNQPDYYNIVITGNTELSPQALLLKIKDIEQKLGRVKTGRWKERIIDIDIIDYSGAIYRADNLCIPHCSMHERSFVILPMLEICSDYIHPEIKLTLKQIYDNIGNKLNISKVEHKD